MLTLRLYFAQRLTALIMAPLTLGHLAVMIYAVQDGLSVAEILARTQGSVAWFLFYGSFVLAVAVHAAIGLRVVISEWLGVRGIALSVFSWAVLVMLLVLGGRAVWTVTFDGGFP
jgi:fumarate reductase subunit C